MNKSKKNNTLKFVYFYSCTCIYVIIYGLIWKIRRYIIGFAVLNLFIYIIGFDEIIKGN